MMKVPSGHAKRIREAVAQERVRKAAPALLEALEEIIGDYETPENYGVKIMVSKKTMEKAKSAIKQARGE